MLLGKTLCGLADATAQPRWRCGALGQRGTGHRLGVCWSRFAAATNSGSGWLWKGCRARQRKCILIRHKIRKAVGQDLVTFADVAHTGHFGDW